MRAGMLRKRVTIQELTGTRDAAGGVSQVWTDVGETWASIEPLKSDERMAAQMVQSETTTRIRMRYRRDLTITSAMRIKYGTRYFQVEGPVINSYERNKEIIAMCREIEGREV